MKATRRTPHVDPAWLQISSRRWMVPAVAVFIWVIDTRLIVGSGLYDPAALWGIGDTIRWEFVIATVVIVSVVLAYSQLPLVHAWACLSQLAPLIGFDLGWPAYSDTPAPYIGAALIGAWPSVVAAFVLRYPTPRLSLAHQRWTAGLLATIPALALLELLTLDPERIGRVSDGRLTLAWPSGIHDRYVYPALALAEFAALSITTGLLVRRWKDSRGAARPGLLALAVAAGFVTVAAAMTRLAQASFWWTGGVSTEGQGWGGLTQTLSDSWVLAPAILALSALVEVFQRRSAQAAAIEKVVVAACAGLGESLDRAVREALGDETAKVAEAGEAGSFRRPSDSYLSVRTDEGNLLAVLVTDPAASFASSEMIATVVDALRLGLDNERLRASRRVVMRDLADSRARAVEAALDERRRVERDLHDGAQQALLGVSAVLARADLVPEGEPLTAIAADAADRLSRARTDLDRLTAGVQPVELAVGGLAQALPVLAAGATLDVRLTVPAAAFEVKLPAPLEAVAYFVVAEALSNAVKHARAHQVEVNVVKIGDSLQVAVTDDGTGGARIEAGGGLAGLAERVSAVGGHLEVRSEPNRGSRVLARMPVPE